jgi:hypothetical protein
MLLAVGARAAVVPAPGFAVRTIPTPATVVGGVVRSGNAILVGQGTFGTGTEQIVRLDGAVATTLATGFNSLGGFDVGAGTLYTVDNCYGSDVGCSGATTGDSLYAIPDAFTTTAAVTAGASAVLPAGSIAAGQDVLVVPGAILVSDAVGVGAGKVLKVAGTTVTDLATGLDFLGGLATDGTTLFVGNVDGSFVGSVRKYTLAGAPSGTLVNGLSGTYGVAVDGSGDVLVTGGFTSDFSSSTLVAVGASAAVTEWAHGFSFSSDVFFDAARGAALVLDFGATSIAAVCPDADADGICDADCAGPAAMDRPKVQIGRQNTPLGDDTLKLTGAMTIPTVPAVDPPTSGARVLVDDANGRVVVDVALPSGAYDPLTKTGWLTRGGGSAWTFRHPTGVVGITKMTVRTSAKAPGLVKVAVTGKNGAYDTSGVALPLHAVVALTAAGQCGSATFTGPDSTCAFDARGATLTCK